MISTPLRSTLGVTRVQRGSGSRRWIGRGRCQREEPGAGEQLASEFSQFLLKHDVQSLPRRPSHLMSPTLVVASQMAALQRNDWPEMDAGVKTAFAFSKPLDELEAKRCRTWFAEEQWLTLEEFTQMLHQHPYAALIDCDAWQPISDMIFPSQRKEVAVQAISIMTIYPKDSASKREFLFTFCLERMTTGPHKDCWMTSGVRFGNYAT